MYIDVCIYKVLPILKHICRTWPKILFQEDEYRVDNSLELHLGRVDVAGAPWGMEASPKDNWKDMGCFLKFP